MGTHPIFESDFDCLTVGKQRKMTSTDDEPDEDLGERWAKFKADNWERTNYSSKFQDEYGNEIDWRTDPEARLEYFNQVETDYTYFCYDQKDPEACQKRADFMATFRLDNKEAGAEYDRCCATYGTPGCCLNAAKFNMRQFMMAKKDNSLRGFDFEQFWAKMATACNAPDYPRSKQQQDNRGQACLEIYKARRNRALKEREQLDPLQQNLPNYLNEIDLAERLKRTCQLDNASSNWESCSTLSAALINPKLAAILNVPLDPLKGLEYAMRACEGGGPGLGDHRACANLANMFERGNRQLGIEPNARLAEEYKVKAWYQTEEGQKHIAQVNLPTAGSTY